MIEIPLEHLPNQELNMRIGTQNVTLHVYQRGLGDEIHMYMDVAVGSEYIQQGAPLIPRAGILCEPNNFDGQFRLIDSASQPDWQTMPNYEEIGFKSKRNRYQLYYLTAEEEAEIKALHQSRAEAAASAALATGLIEVQPFPSDDDDDSDSDSDTDSDSDSEGASDA